MAACCSRYLDARCLESFTNHRLLMAPLAGTQFALDIQPEPSGPYMYGGATSNDEVWCARECIRLVADRDSRWWWLCVVACNEGCRSRAGTCATATCPNTRTHSRTHPLTCLAAAERLVPLLFDQRRGAAFPAGMYSPLVGGEWITLLADVHSDTYDTPAGIDRLQGLSSDCRLGATDRRQGYTAIWLVRFRQGSYRDQRDARDVFEVTNPNRFASDRACRRSRTKRKDEGRRRAVCFSVVLHGSRRLECADSMRVHAFPIDRLNLAEHKVGVTAEYCQMLWSCGDLEVHLGTV